MGECIGEKVAVEGREVVKEEETVKVGGVEVVIMDDREVVGAEEGVTV